MPKYLLTYEKTESVRWLGHLDILRTFERAIRRARLPIAFTNGFNPRERLVFAQALSTGMTGGAEAALMELDEARTGESIAAELNTVLPAGIRIAECRELTEAEAREFPGGFDSAVYEVICDCTPELSAQEIHGAICALLDETQVKVEREREGRVKTVDIRPLLFDLKLVPGTVGEGRFALEMTLAMGDSGTGKVAEVVRALADRLAGTKLRRAHRARLLGPADRVTDERLTAAPLASLAERDDCLVLNIQLKGGE